MFNAAHNLSVCIAYEACQMPMSTSVVSGHLHNGLYIATLVLCGQIVFMFLFVVVKYELEQFTSLLELHNINSLMSSLMPLQSFIVYSYMYLYTATNMLL